MLATRQADASSEARLGFCSFTFVLRTSGARGVGGGPWVTWLKASE